MFPGRDNGPEPLDGSTKLKCCENRIPGPLGVERSSSNEWLADCYLTLTKSLVTPGPSEEDK